jgi:ABC-2 type transport system permease protein
MKRSLLDLRTAHGASVVRCIARKEFVEMWRDGRVRLAAIVVLVLLTIALGLGWQGSSQAAGERTQADRSDRAEWLAQGPRNPHSAAHFGRFAFKPVTTLGFLDRGVNTYLGIAVWMEAHQQDTFRFRAAEDATSLQRFGELTAATVLQLLIPLLIILLAFAQFAGEREQGTLRQLLSLGVGPRDLAAGKTWGIALALAVPLVPLVLFGVAGLALAAGDSSPLWSADRFLLLALVYLLYFSAVLGMSVAVSAWSRSGRLALLTLLGSWIVACLIAPRAAADIAERVAPAPSYAEFWQAVHHDIRDGLNGHDPASKRSQELRQRVLARYNVRRVEDLPINFDGIALQEGEEYGNRVFDRHYGRLWDTFERQNRVQALSAIVTPFAAVRWLSMGLAGTDFANHRHFAVAAEAYRRAMVKQLNDEFRDKAGTAGFSYLDRGELWKHVPDFEYEPLSTTAVLRTHSLSVGLLVGWFALACSAALFSVRRLRAD